MLLSMVACRARAAVVVVVVVPTAAPNLATEPKMRNSGNFGERVVPGPSLASASRHPSLLPAPCGPGPPNFE